MRKRLYSTREAAEYLGLKVQTLYNWRSQSKGPDYVMLGGAPRYDINDLDSYIEINRVDLKDYR